MYKQTKIWPRPSLHFISLIILQQLNKLWSFHIFFASTIPFSWISLLLYFLSSMHKCVPSPVMGWVSPFILFMYVCLCHFHVHRCVSVIISIQQYPYKFRCYQFNSVFVIINSSLFFNKSAHCSHFGQHLKFNKKSQWNLIFYLFQNVLP